MDVARSSMKHLIAPNEIFAHAGFHVAILTATMRRTSAVFFFCSFLAAVPAFAQHWSFGAGVGPFVFGDFARETFTPIGGGVGEPTEVKLTGKSGPGFTADIERDFNGRFALRIQGAFTNSKLQVKSSS